MFEKKNKGRNGSTVMTCLLHLSTRLFVAWQRLALRNLELGRGAHGCRGFRETR